MHPAVPITLVIVHAYEVLRMGLRMVLERQGLIKVVLELADPKGLAAAWPAAGAQVVLLCLGNALHHSLEAVSLVRQRYPETGILVLGELTPEVARRVVEAKVSGLLHSGTTEAELLKGLAVVAQGGLFANGHMREVMLTQKQQGSPSEPPVDLSDMQIKVLRLVCLPEHLSRPQIAQKLGLKTSSVSTHIEALFKKFGVNSRPALMRKGKEWDLRK